IGVSLFVGLDVGFRIDAGERPEREVLAGRCARTFGRAASEGPRDRQRHDRRGGQTGAASHEIPLPCGISCWLGTIAGPGMLAAQVDGRRCGTDRKTVPMTVLLCNVA